MTATLRNVTVFDATPAMADGIIPALYADRPHGTSRFGWVRQTPAWRRVADQVGIDTDHGVNVTGEGVELSDMRVDYPEMVAAGCADVFAFAALAGDLSRTVAVGLSADGCRATVLIHESYPRSNDADN